MTRGVKRVCTYCMRHSRFLERHLSSVPLSLDDICVYIMYGD